MSSPTSTLTLFGPVYLLAIGTITLLATPCTSNPIPISNNEIIQSQPELVRSRRTIENVPHVRADYNYNFGYGGYKVYKKAANWNDAKAACETDGGALAVINSQGEANVLVQLLAKSKPHEGSHNSNYAFIGFTDIFTEDQFRTVDGKTLSQSGFEQWASGEPDDGKGMGEDCGTTDQDGKLGDASCTKRYAYICELPFPSIPEGSEYTLSEDQKSIPGDELITIIAHMWSRWQSTSTTTTPKPPSFGRPHVRYSPGISWSPTYTMNDAALGVAAGVGTAAVIGALATSLSSAAPLLLVG